MYISWQVSMMLIFGYVFLGKYVLKHIDKHRNIQIRDQQTLFMLTNVGRGWELNPQPPALKVRSLPTKPPSLSYHPMINHLKYQITLCSLD